VWPQSALLELPGRQSLVHKPWATLLCDGAGCCCVTQDTAQSRNSTHMMSCIQQYSTMNRRTAAHSTAHNQQHTTRTGSTAALTMSRALTPEPSPASALKASSSRASRRTVSLMGRGPPSTGIRLQRPSVCQHSNNTPCVTRAQNAAGAVLHVSQSYYRKAWPTQATAEREQLSGATRCCFVLAKVRPKFG
jgi:hypothetical protein